MTERETHTLFLSRSRSLWVRKSQEGRRRRGEGRSSCHIVCHHTAAITSWLPIVCCRVPFFLFYRSVCLSSRVGEREGGAFHQAPRSANGTPWRG